MTTHWTLELTLIDYSLDLSLSPLHRLPDCRVAGVVGVAGPRADPG